MALKRLNPEHLIAIRYLALPNRGGLTIEQIAQECGVSRQAVWNWRSDPLFESELKKQIRRNLLDRVPSIGAAMADAAEAEHNAAAAKLVLQMTDVLTERIDVTTTEGTSLNREELDRKIAEYQARKVEE
ncbi:phBC6A51 family helix-turn-helix protein [Paenibacillus nitricinens]|uniref:phBC6A51 family helix-turn-helix protein n=1 Tax=Paenibacillus nitricinens TaxID=3367691 RepID=UPI003F853EA5